MMVGNGEVPSRRIYPFWEGPNMPLHEAFRRTVGFVMGEISKPGGIELEPVGTFFLLQVPNGEGEAGADVLMVTCRHVVDRDGMVRVRMRDTAGRPETWDANDWILPADPSLDLAIHRWSPPSQVLQFRAVPVEDSFESIGFGPPAPGVPVYFAGLLKDVESMGLEGVPVVRTAAVAAWAEADIRWTTREATETTPLIDRWIARHAHLIDTKSIGGFSGSPCWVQFTVPGPRQKPMSGEWSERARRSGNDPQQLGEMHTMTMWCGMFTAHIHGAGIGIVESSLDIMKFIENSEEVRKMRDELRHEREIDKIEQGAIGQSVVSASTSAQDAF